MYIDKVIQQIRSLGEEEAQGCSEAEIAELEALLPGDTQLPGAYREFLLFGGKKAGNLFRTLDISFKSTLLMRKGGNQEVFDSLMLEDDQPVPEEWLVFNENEMMSFSFFKLNEGDNPPVYYWEEGMDESLEGPQKSMDSFSEWLLDLVGRHKQLIEAKS